MIAFVREHWMLLAAPFGAALIITATLGWAVISMTRRSRVLSSHFAWLVYGSLFGAALLWFSPPLPFLVTSTATNGSLVDYSFPPPYTMQILPIWAAVSAFASRHFGARWVDDDN